uniref:Osteoclastosis associated transmembrane protein 1 n=1 Tax=Salvator merianae TaxID=96440 RepID=A0A8D0C4J2_SALMN
MASLLLLVLLLGLCTGEPLFPRGSLSLQNGWSEISWGAWRRPLSLEVLEAAAEDLSSALGSGLGAADPLEFQLEPECRELLASFSNSSVRFTGCLARNARPVRLCQNCYRQFQDVTEQLENITNVVGNASAGTHCAKSLLMADRLQIIVILYKFFSDTWKKANCANCLTNSSEGLSNNTVTFLALFNESLTCFELNLQRQEENLLPSNITDVCKKCNGTYKKLNDMYNKMQWSEQKYESREGFHLCIDVEDAMNITRRLWSTTFNCSVPISDTVPVIAVSSFIFFLPIVFYLSSFLHSKQKKRILIPTKRIQSNASLVNIQEKSH